MYMYCDTCIVIHMIRVIHVHVIQWGSQAVIVIVIIVLLHSKRVTEASKQS